MERFLKLSQVILGLGFFALAAALFFFSVELRSLRQQLPELLTQIDSTVQRVEPVLDDLDKIEQLIPLVLEQSENYQQLIPEVLNRVDDLNQKIDLFIPQIPLILAESEALRAEVPIILDQSEVLIAKASNIGREASSGFFTGLVGGVISSPFDLLSQMGAEEAKQLGIKNANHFTEQDKLQYAQALEALMEKPRIGAKQAWSNSESGNHGEILIEDRIQQGDQWCYQLHNHLVIAKGEDKGNYQILRSSCDQR